MNEHPLPLLPLVLARVPQSLRRILAQTGVPFVEQAVAPAAGKFLVFDSTIASRHPVPGQMPIDVNALRSGWSEDPFALLEDESAIRRAWKLGALTPCETVSRVDKRVVRERLLGELRKRVENAGGVWLRVGVFPFGYRSAFNFRIDHDEYNPRDFAATLAAIRGHEDGVSHYVCASTHAPHPESLARLAGRHVGSHGYRHHTYADFEANLRNVRRGIESLAAAGIEPLGFAAPHGKFNRGLHQALQTLGVEHSSEFGLGYDDLPFCPYDGRVLQLPVHPICLGVCLDAAREQAPPCSPADAAQIAFSHFRRIIAEKREAGEPIFLYGHPDGRLGRFPHVLRAALQSASRHSDVWCTTLARFADWWRARSRVTFEATREDGDLVVRAGRVPLEHAFALEFCRGDETASLPLSAGTIRITPHGPLPNMRRLAPRLYPESVDQPEALRASLRRYLDWERVTPIDEIDVRTWRGWAKRTLRLIKN